jgi:hypothetical protein
MVRPRWYGYVRNAHVNTRDSIGPTGMARSFLNGQYPLDRCGPTGMARLHCKRSIPRLDLSESLKPHRRRAPAPQPGRERARILCRGQQMLFISDYPNLTNHCGNDHWDSHWSIPAAATMVTAPRPPPGAKTRRSTAPPNPCALYIQKLKCMAV